MAIDSLQLQCSALALHFESRKLVFIEEGKRGGEVLSLLSLGYFTTHSALFAARQLKSLSVSPLGLK